MSARQRMEYKCKLSEEMKTFRSYSGFAFILVIVLAASISGQTTPAYSYDAQKKFIPVELGRVYLGMPFKEFVKLFDFKNSDVGDMRFGNLAVTVPINKGNVTEVHFKIHDLDEEEITAMVYEETVQVKEVVNGETLEFPRTYKRLDPSKALDKGFLYQIVVTYKPEFDLRSHVIKTYGNKGEVRKPDDDYHFSDIEWSPKTADGLLWLIRSLHEGKLRSLNLIGRMPDTEWDPTP